MENMLLFQQNMKITRSNLLKHSYIEEEIIYPIAKNVTNSKILK